MKNKLKNDFQVDNENTKDVIIEDNNSTYKLPSPHWAKELVISLWELTETKKNC